jgi:hypothetical protein
MLSKSLNVCSPAYLPCVIKKFIFRENLQNSVYKYTQFYDGGISSGLNSDNFSDKVFFIKRPKELVASIFGNRNFMQPMRRLNM